MVEIAKTLHKLFPKQNVVRKYVGEKPTKLHFDNSKLIKETKQELVHLEKSLESMVRSFYKFGLLKEQ